MSQNEQEKSTRDGVSEAAAFDAMNDDAVSFEPPESETDPETGDPDYPVEGA